MEESIPLVRRGYLHLLEEGTEQVIAVGTPAWYTWLAQATSFVFVGKAGSFTASKQHFEHKKGVWRAYTKRDGKRHSVNLGLSQRLGPERLNHAADLLTRHKRPTPAGALPTSPTRPSRQWANMGSFAAASRQYATPGLAQHEIQEAAVMLATKLTIPFVPQGTVSRPRLLEQVSAGVQRKFTLLSAPAGSGKTTLLGEWCAQRAAQVAWVALDRRDNDTMRFWGNIIVALERVQAGIGAGAWVALQRTQPPDIEEVLASLIQALLQREHKMVLVLDDYHLITNATIHADLRWLLERMPPTLHLILSSRADPPFPLARLRVQGQVSELHAADLCFTEEELTTFFTQTHQLTLSLDEQRLLVTSTEGWIGGIQLAALALSQQEDRTSFLRAFTRGQHATLADYLVEEVLQQQPPVVQDFLMETSILDRLSGSLCEVVTRQPHGQEMLERLERVRLFLVPLDQERRWYRYHQLFAEFLQARLQRIHPEQVAMLHRRASHWYEGQGMLHEAILHALAAKDHILMARLVEGVAADLLESGEFTTLLEWIAALPPEELFARPTLGVTYALALSIMGQPEAAEAQLEVVNRQILEKHLRQADEQDEVSQTLRGQIATVRGQIAYQRDDHVCAIDWYEQALAQLPAAQPFLRALCALRLGTSYQLVGKTQARQKICGKGTGESQATGNRLATLICLYYQGRLKQQQGFLLEAVAAFRQALQLVPDRIEHLVPGTGMVLSSIGEIFYEWDELEAAAHHAKQGLAISQREKDIMGQELSLFLLARLKYLQQDQAGFLQLLEQLEQGTHNSRLLPSHSAQIARAWHTRLGLLAGKLDQATRWAAAYSIQVEDAPAYPLEVMPLTLARVLLAQGRFADVLPFLERLASVAEAAGRTDRLLESLVLQAMALQDAGKYPSALRVLARALTIGERGGYLRLFADEGASMVTLLKQLVHTQNTGTQPRLPMVSHPYLRRVLDASRTLAGVQSGSTVLPKLGAPSERLSQREVEVVRLLAQGHSNQEIAEVLVLERSTVKWYLQQIYQKLHLQRRTQLVRYAQEAHLV